jgi:ABC-type transport system involved in multi-copper enzyme maturation permease subunit
MNYQTGLRLKILRLLGVNGFTTQLAGWGIYVVVTIMSACAALLITGYQGSVREDGLLVTGNPLNFPFNLAVMATGIYLSLAALIATARERESGTMEVLFYGPVDPLSYMAGKLLENLLSLGLMLAAYLGVFFILGWVSHFGCFTFPVHRIMLACVYAAALIATGICVAALLNSVRTAVLTLSGVWLGFAALQWGKPLVPEGIGATLLAMGAQFSPFYRFEQGLRSLANSDGVAYLIALGALMGWTLLTLSGAVAILARKGVKMR